MLDFGTLSNIICTSYNSNHNITINYLEKAVNIQLKTIGKYNLDTASTYRFLGIAYGCIGQYTKSIEYYKVTKGLLRKRHFDAMFT